VPVSSASAVTITVPNNASAPFPVGTTLYVAQDGAGQVSIAAASGVLVQTAQGYKVGGQWQDVALHKRDLNTWVLKGGV
jgi:acetaldehyde dehydrogenase (acetylating)